MVTINKCISVLCREGNTQKWYACTRPLLHVRACMYVLTYVCMYVCMYVCIQGVPNYFSMGLKTEFRYLPRIVKFSVTLSFLKPGKDSKINYKPKKIIFSILIGKMNFCIMTLVCVLLFTWWPSNKQVSDSVCPVCFSESSWEFLLLSKRHFIPHTHSKPNFSNFFPNIICMQISFWLFLQDTNCPKGLDLNHHVWILCLLSGLSVEPAGQIWRFAFMCQW